MGDFGDCRDQLRPTGTGSTEPVPGGEENDEVLKTMSSSAPTTRGASVAAATAVPQQPATAGAVAANAYYCVYFSGNHLVDAAGINITGANTYKNRDGVAGTYSFDSASSPLTFHGGNYDGQRADYEVKGGRPSIHSLAPSGRRVIDCD